MVTQMVIRVTQAEAAALATTASWSSAVAESIIKNAPTEEMSTKVLVPLCNHPSWTTRAQHHPSLLNAAGRGEKKRALPLDDDLIGSKLLTHKRQRVDDTSILDLSDVPAQPTIPKSKGRIKDKEGASKYTGVYFDKKIKNWQARIMINGKGHHIGYYENEDEAAADYARAVFKYKGQEALDKARGVKKEVDQGTCDKERETEARVMSRGRIPLKSYYLSDVPPQPPIPRSKGRITEGSSKYVGVYFQRNKWMARIDMDGKFRCIGSYENEEEAAVDYARAVFKYKQQGATKKQKSNIIDLSDVPPQPPIPKSKGRMKEGSSKYTGVSFHRNKWVARIDMDGKFRIIGNYENEEEAAVDYARAVFKYKQQGASKEKSNIIDLSDVPPQPPIPRSKGRIKEGSSKYTGVFFQRNKWVARIDMDGKFRIIGYYENEEEAAVDYARAVFKYKKQGATKKQKENIIDLSDVPPQPPIPKSEGYIKEGSSKYTGVSFHRNKWVARIDMDGKFRVIGSYENEEEAAVDYARAVFKYKKQGATKKEKENIIDLSDVPPQPPIPKKKGFIKEGSSKYTGVSFQRNKWVARIDMDGKFRIIGSYENQEEAAIDYARAVFKYKKQKHK